MSPKEKTLKKVESLWPEINQFVTVPKTKTQYNSKVKILDYLIDEVGNNESHPWANLMETLGLLIEAYENEHVAHPDHDPIENLKFLMLEHGLKQSDLKEIGSQGVVSEILSGKRILNTRQVKILSEKFGVSPAVFI